MTVLELKSIFHIVDKEYNKIADVPIVLVVKNEGPSISPFVHL